MNLKNQSNNSNNESNYAEINTSRNSNYEPLKINEHHNEESNYLSIKTDKSPTNGIYEPLRSSPESNYMSIHPSTSPRASNEPESNYVSITNDKRSSALTVTKGIEVIFFIVEGGKDFHREGVIFYRLF